MRQRNTEPETDSCCLIKSAEKLTGNTLSNEMSNFIEFITIYKYILDLSAIIVVGIFHCCVVAHLPSHVVGSVGVVGHIEVLDDLGRPPEVPHLLALDQPDDKEDQKCDDKGTCLNQISVIRASFSTPVDQTDHDDETST